MIVKEKVTITLPKDLMDEVRAIASVRGYSQFIAELSQPPWMKITTPVETNKHLVNLVNPV
jgi:hypothetical protein